MAEEMVAVSEETEPSDAEMDRQRKLPDVDLQLGIRLHTPGERPNHVIKEEFPLQPQEWSITLDHNKPQLPHIKEEEEEVFIKQEQVHYCAVDVKGVKDEEKSELSLFDESQTVKQMKEESRGSDPEGNFGLETEDMMEDSSITDDSEDDLNEGGNPIRLKVVSDWNHSKCNAGEELDSIENCKTIFDQSQLLRREISDCGGRIPNPSECTRTVIEDHDLEDSEVDIAEKRPYKCSVCGNIFTQRKNLLVHYRIHTGEKPFSCSECGKRFTYQSDLRRHEKTHTGEKPFPCPECGKGFANTSNLKRHEKVHSGEKPFSCSVCGKVFSEKCTLKNHVVIHTGERPFVCFVCSKTFSRSSDLKTHERIHERPYGLSACGNNFKLKTREKRFICAMCGKGFTNRANLKTHERIHTGEKPFVCSVCGVGFTNTSNLKTHERIHTGEKPFGCCVCDSRFTRSCDLKRHEKVHARV